LRPLAYLSPTPTRVTEAVSKCREHESRQPSGAGQHQHGGEDEKVGEEKQETEPEGQKKGHMDGES
jgi:hypothetical protein